MSFYRWYPNRKDWRRPYWGAPAHDSSCRPHGGCQYCLENRMHSTRKRLEAAKESEEELTDTTEL